MSLRPIDFDSLNRTPDAGRAAGQPSGGSGGFVVVTAIVLLAAWLLFFRAPGPGPGPSPTPDVDVDGEYVMVVLPDDMSRLSRGQAEFANSAKVADWVESRGGQYRRYMESQDLSNESEVFRWIRDKLSGDGERVGVLKDRRLRKMPIPDGLEAGIRTLEGL